jgi:hypothetical protein
VSAATSATTSNGTEQAWPLLQQMDGRRTIREIMVAASQRGELPPQSQAELDQLGKSVFQLLWRADFLAIGRERVS